MNSNALNEASRLIGGEGWDALGENAAKRSKQQQQQDLEAFKFAEIVAAAFTGRRGKLALDNLRTRFVNPPTWTPNVTNIDDTTAYGFIREGQKSVLTFIENCIKRVEQGPPTSEE